MESLVQDILSKKELKNLDKKLVEEELEKYFERNRKMRAVLVNKGFNKRSKEYKTVTKDIRKTLREIYGVFIQKNYSRREKLLSKIKKENKEETIKQILLLHQSTKERLQYYKEIYKKLFKITGKQKTILDLACGLNPLSYFWLGYKPKYIASEISSKDLEFIQEFFKKTAISGKTIQIDLVTEQKKLKSVKADICFLFKALDSLEARKKNISKTLIEEVNAKWIVISFSKISLGGKKNIQKSKRNWITNFLKSKNYYYREFEVPNEHFLVVKKKFSTRKNHKVFKRDNF
ncbi:hypothetical protein HQ533_02665 [Candidatus Woesearchaeota archaeon]|nr:hypothetical protein [Candidatus Woesearchaeota archaeon]